MPNTVLKGVECHQDITRVVSKLLLFCFHCHTLLGDGIADSFVIVSISDLMTATAIELDLAFATPLKVVQAGAKSTLGSQRACHGGHIPSRLING